MTGRRVALIIVALLVVALIIASLWDYIWITLIHSGSLEGE